MRVYETKLTTGITRSREFERKGLAAFAVNVGTKCGHGCLYCSTGALLRCHRSFEEVGESPFKTGYAIVDPTTPERVARDARRLRKRGLVQVCTTTDAWSPEAQQHALGRRCLAAILSESGWTVRVLTKNAAVVDDFPLIKQHRDRVVVGLSLTALPCRSDVMAVVEPHASPLGERISAMNKAHTMRLRTYAMLCPLLPGIADELADVETLVETALKWNVEEIFAETVNARGPGLRLTEEALAARGFVSEAEAVGQVRSRAGWSRYAVNLIHHLQRAVRKHGDISKLRILLYGSRLLPDDEAAIRADDSGVVWL